MIGAWRSELCASGTRLAPLLSAGTHWVAPAWLFDWTQSNANRLSRYCEDHLVGVALHAHSRPLVTVSAALPLPHLFSQPKPCFSRLVVAGSAPTHLSGAYAP